MTIPRKMNPRHRQVVDLWFGNGFNKAKALKDAGYSESVSKSGCNQIFKRKDVKQYILHKQELLKKKFEVTEESVTAELAKLAFSNMGDLLVVQEDGSAYIDFNLMTPEQRAALAEFTVEQYMEGRGEGAMPVKKTKIKFADKKGSLELLGRKLGMFNDKLKVDLHDTTIADRLRAGRLRVNKMAKGEKGK